MHTAARYGHAGVARILIAARCNVNETNKNGDTALHIAAALKHRKIAALLLDVHASVSVRNRQQDTPIDIAMRKSHSEICELLRDSERKGKPCALLILPLVFSLVIFGLPAAPFLWVYSFAFCH